MTGDSSSPPTVSGLDREILQRLVDAVEALGDRVDRLESRFSEAPPTEAAAEAPSAPEALAPPAGPFEPVEPVQTPVVETPAATAPTPTPTPTPSPVPAPATRPAAFSTPTPYREWWQSGPLRDVGKEHFPVVALGAVGGLAMLLGLLYFVWYSIEQGWIPISVRLYSGAAMGLGAMALSWRIADKGHKSVAGGLAGAGLGAWFGTILVARHVHDLLGPTPSFALLVTGAAGGLFLATKKDLRTLASLATVGALLTPVAASAGGDHLHELMLYQLVILGLNYVLEWRKGWPELGHLSLVSAWVLLFGWSTEYLTGPNRGGMLAWSVALAIVGHAQAWLMMRKGTLKPPHAHARVWLGCIAAWSTATIAAETPEQTAWVALGLGLWNLAVAAFVAFDHKREEGPLAGPAKTALGFGWTQLVAFGGLQWGAHDEPLMALWWTGLTAVAVVAHLATHRWRALWLAALSGVPAWIWAMDANGPRAASIGIALSGLVILLGLWPRKGEASEAMPEGEATVFPAIALAIGAVLWMQASWVHFDGGRIPPIVLCLVPAVLATARQWWRPERARGVVTLTLVVGATVQAIFVGGGHHSWNPLMAAPGRSTEMLTLAIAAGCALALSRRWQTPFPGDPGNTTQEVRDAAVVLTAICFTATAMLATTAFLSATDLAPFTRGSLNQALWSVEWAVAGLVLMIRGLVGQSGPLRRAGLAALVMTAGKLVLVDLTHVSMALRVLSFVGLGAAMLGGAYAYRKLGDRYGLAD